MGLIYATLGEHELAVEQFMGATGLDQYLAVAYVAIRSSSLFSFLSIPRPSYPLRSRYFQCGVSNFLLGRYDLASKDFEEALLYLRGNQSMYVLLSPSPAILILPCFTIVITPNLVSPLPCTLPRFFSIRVRQSSHLSFAAL